MLAIANALEGMSRAEAARLVGMERQALHDAVARYNVEGLAGRPARPTQAGPARAAERGRAGGPGSAGVPWPRPGAGWCRPTWTRADLCGWLEERFGKPFRPSSLSRVLRQLDLSWQKVRPVHPEADPAAQESFRKRGSATR
jgi:transposase